MTSQLNVALICKLSESLMCMACFLDMFTMGVFTTRHLQTSGRLVQELNVCTVPALRWIQDYKPNTFTFTFTSLCIPVPCIKTAHGVNFSIQCWPLSCLHLTILPLQSMKCLKSLCFICWPAIIVFVYTSKFLHWKHFKDC